jgi:uncharacterized membrane protein YczE
VCRETRRDGVNSGVWRPILALVESERSRDLVRWCTRRAWSRAGAVAVVLSGAPRRVLATTSRLALLVVGSALIGVAVATMLWNDLGPGPLDVFIVAVRDLTGVPLTIAVWMTVGSMLLVTWALGRRPGLGTLGAPFLIGPVTQAALAWAERVDHPHHLAAQVGVHVLAIATAGVGAGMLIVSGLGAGTGELLATAASDRSGHPEPRVRMAFEATWAVLGVSLGGPVGLGTVLVALLIGPAVATGHRLVDGVAASSRRRVVLAFG